MFSADQYAASIVDKYRVVADTTSDSHQAADEVLPLIKEWGKQYLLGMTLSGAYAKNTAISLSSDVDVLIALKPVPGQEMKNIFWGLFEYLSDKGVRPHTRNVSIQVVARGHKVDLIPAYRDRDTGGDILFNKKSRSVVHTDVGRHVHRVANCGRQQEIAALKIWRERKSLDFPSLYLELTVLNALEHERFGKLAENVLTVLRYLGNKFERLIVRDPANGENIVSNDLSEAEKKAIATLAREAVYDENWKAIVY